MIVFLAESITYCFIKDSTTVGFDKIFLEIIYLVYPTTSKFLEITFFQVTSKKIKSLILSLLRKGGLDIPFMLLLNKAIDIQCIAWTTPIADALAVIVSLFLIILHLKSIKRA